MTKQKDKAPVAELRRRAEGQIAQRGERKKNNGRRPPPPAPAKLVHELQVHQIELEMQNEELLRSRAEVEAVLERYSELYDFAPVGYFTLGRDGSIQRANLTGARLLGVERSVLATRRFGTFVADADRSAFNASLERAFERQSNESCEVALARSAQGGSPRRHVQLTASRSEDGRECRVVVVDVSERKMIEEQLRASQKMDAMGRLAGGVAHDFNNLLTVILSHADLGLEAVPSGDALRNDLVEMKAAAERAAALTRQLLAFSRKQVIRPQVIDVNTLVSGLASMLRRLLGEPIELLHVLADDLWRAEIDPGQLEQVIVNLAVNARDAMGQGGKLTIETANVNLDERCTGRYLDAKHGPFVVVTVSDTGVGMDETTRSHLFEPFFTTKEMERGTGFGLATVYGILKQCGADIFVHSELFRGTTFKVYLPRATSVAAASMTVPKRSEAWVGGTETILVVEDEDPLRRVVERILVSVGYAVLTAANGSEALRICEQHPGVIHLVLSDVVMPIMGGAKFAERVKELRPEIKVLYMSGHTDDAFARHGVLRAGTQFIDKPFSAQALMRKLRDVIDGSGYAAEAMDFERVAPFRN